MNFETESCALFVELSEGAIRGERHYFVLTLLMHRTGGNTLFFNARNYKGRDPVCCSLPHRAFQRAKPTAKLGRAGLWEI